MYRIRIKIYIHGSDKIYTGAPETKRNLKQEQDKIYTEVKYSGIPSDSQGGWKKCPS